MIQVEADNLVVKISNSKMLGLEGPESYQPGSA